MVVIYLGSLAAMLVNSFYQLDDFSGKIVQEFTLKNYAALFQPANLSIILRTVSMAAVVTVACAVLAFPLAYYMARYASPRAKGFLYLAVLMPLWSSYIVRVYAWKLILSREGLVAWLADQIGAAWLLNGVLATPVIGGPSLSVSFLGMFLAYVYVWLPYMVLPVQASLEKVPKSYLEASCDLGARPGQTFRNVILPLSFPGIVAGSIFTFSLTLGDFVVPAGAGQLCLLHRPGRARLPGHRRQPAAGRGDDRRADGDHDHLSAGRQTAWRVRGAVRESDDGSKDQNVRQ